MLDRVMFVLALFMASAFVPAFAESSGAVITKLVITKYPAVVIGYDSDGQEVLGYPYAARITYRAEGQFLTGVSWGSTTNLRYVVEGVPNRTPVQIGADTFEATWGTMFTQPGKYDLQIVAYGNFQELKFFEFPVTITDMSGKSARRRPKKTTKRTFGVWGVKRAMVRAREAPIEDQF